MADGVILVSIIQEAMSAKGRKVFEYVSTLFILLMSKLSCMLMLMRSSQFCRGNFSWVLSKVSLSLASQIYFLIPS